MAFKWWNIDEKQVAQPYYLIISDECIGRVPTSNLSEDVLDTMLNNGQEPESLRKIRLDLIKSVHIEEGKPELVVTLVEGRKEIFPVRSIDSIFGAFHHLKEQRSVTYSLEKPSAIGAGKNILILAVILSALMGWAYYVAVGLENGDAARPSFFLIDLLAGLGTQTLTLVYTLLAGLCFVLLIQKIGRPVVRHVLRFE